MNITQVQQQESLKHRRGTKHRLIFWLCMSVFVAGACVIAGLTIFNILNIAGGVTVFAAFSVFMALVAAISSLLTGRSVQPTVPGAIAIAIPYQETIAIPWNIPYPRNLFFTGRDSILKELHKRLASHKRLADHQTTALTHRQAISGQGGIGKTQIAIEYAYRHRTTGDYSAILWVKADTRENILISFQEIARLLGLPTKGEADLNTVAAAVKRWLEEHDGWLLNFDNADDLRLVEDFLPSIESGALLFTTRSKAPGTLARSIDIAQMDWQEGILLLLRRAKRLAPDDQLEQAISPEERVQAEQIVQQLEGFPLAIDQAAAYIEQTGCPLENYYQAYHNRWMELLQERGDDPYTRKPVATTWSLNLEQVEQNRAASDLLQALAFLAPDTIPEDLLLAVSSQLSPSFEGSARHESLEQAIDALHRFSLVQRNPDLHLFSIHRLVQEIVRTRMSDAMRRVWAERTVRAVNKAFPQVDFSTWPQCELYLPHALACAALAEDFSLNISEAAHLLNQMALYLQERSQYAEAEPLFQRALAIWEQAMGSTHPVTANGLNNLAALYHNQGRYEEAEPLFQRALVIKVQVLGLTHRDTVLSLDNLAALYQSQGRYMEAEPLYRCALAIWEQAGGPNHLDTATSFNNLADLYRSQGRYREAEPLYRHALAVLEKELGPDHPDTLVIRDNYGRLLEAMKRVQRFSLNYAQVAGEVGEKSWLSS